MAKKSIKAISAVVLCVVMLMVSVMPAFAVTYVENHDVIDCTNRYKQNDGYLNFTIKIPKGMNYRDVRIAFTANPDGYKMFTTDLGDLGRVTYQRSDETSDYYEFLINYSNHGVGIKLYCYYNGSYYMATDNANGSTTEGRGYWQS